MQSLRSITSLLLAVTALLAFQAVAIAQAGPVAHTAICSTTSVLKAKKALRTAKRLRLRALRSHHGTRARRAHRRHAANVRLRRARRAMAAAHRCARRKATVSSTSGQLPAATSSQAARGEYSWDFESGEQGNGCSKRGLSCPGLVGWDVPQWKEMANGQTRAVDPATYGVPARDGGTNDHVLRASVSEAQRDAGQYAAYLYKVWAVAAPETTWQNEFTDAPYERMTRGQEAGSYTAWYYLPESTKSTLQHNSDETHGWVNIMQFKHSNPNMDGPGQWNQPPEWWVNIRNNDPNRITLVVSHEGDPGWGDRAGQARQPEVPFGRWFQLRADIHPGNRIEFYLDGKLFETGHQSDQSVGLNPGDSSWIFSPGYYLNTGTAFIDDVSFDRKPANW